MFRVFVSTCAVALCTTHGQNKTCKCDTEGFVPVANLNGVVVRKHTVHVETKTVNMRHQAQKGFRGIFVGIPQHQKGYLVYVPITKKVILSYDVRFDESFVSAMPYSSRPYAEAMAMRQTVTYTPYATSSKEQTGDLITFAQFEEVNVLTETRNDA